MIEIRSTQLLAVGPEWANLYAFAQAHPFSQLTIIFREGKPVMVEKGIESVKLN